MISKTYGVTWERKYYINNGSAPADGQWVQGSDQKTAPSGTAYVEIYLVAVDNSASTSQAISNYENWSFGSGRKSHVRLDDVVFSSTNGQILEAFNAVSSARVIEQAEVLATVEGRLEASVGWKAETNGAYSEIKLYAYEDLDDPGAQPQSGVLFDSDLFTFRGGMALFEGTNLQSDDFVAGISGWIIRADGTAEFTDIIDRSDLIEGSVSDGETVVDYIIAQQVDDNTDSNETAPLGPSSPDQVWFIGVKGDVREPRNGSGRTEVWIQRQLNSGGSWGLWRDITPLPSIDSTANNFEEQSDVLMYAPATSVDNIRFRCRVRLVGHTTATQTNVEDLILNVTGIRR